MELLHVGVGSLNQTPLDWSANCSRIIEAIKEARSRGVQLLCLPELCISGYGCEDAFFSTATQAISLESLAEIIGETSEIVVSVGLPLMVQGQLRNACCIIANRQICGISLKRTLPKDGIHYEPRWFHPWTAGKNTSLSVCGQKVPVGDLLFNFQGVSVGVEICEDAWVNNRPASQLATAGANIILNPSASHFAFAKNKLREKLVAGSSSKYNCAYLYANLLGNEAGRIIYDGNSLIGEKGAIAAYGQRFSFSDSVVTSCTVAIERNGAELGSALSDSEEEANLKIVKSDFKFKFSAKPIAANRPLEWENDKSLKEQEFSRAVALGLFDYLRKSHSKGFVVSLSGGADSSGVACLVAISVVLAVRELGVATFFNRLSHIQSFAAQGSTSETISNIIGQLLTCVYQSTKNSSETTRNAAKSLAAELGAEFHAISIDELVDSYTRIFETETNVKTSWETHDAVLQNIQARARGPFVWMIANAKQALLLATSNRSEAAVGYTTMDGDTCGGLSPIGGIDKAFLLSWLKWIHQGGLSQLGPIASLADVIKQAPTAELRPLSAVQTDESDLMPYLVLDRIESLAIGDRLSPAQVYEVLRVESFDYKPEELGEWVRRFFSLWSNNQWKRERYAPSFHLDDKNLDPKTWCRFPILSGGFKKELTELRDKQGFKQ